MPRIVFLDASGAEVTSLTYGFPFVVRVESLAPAATATVTCAMQDFLSSASFAVAADGTIDVSRDAPMPGGSYTGVDADGPVWSMHRDGTDTITDYDLDFVATIDGVEQARAHLHRVPMGETATHTMVTDDGLVAELWLPAGATGPLPVVVTFGGSEGGITSAEREARYFTTFGWAAFAVAYFGMPGLPDQLSEIPLEYFDRALAWVSTRPEIDATHLVLWGGSRGGELVLQLGADSPLVHGVIADVPSGLRVPGVDGMTFGAPWTRGGVALPYLPPGHGTSVWETLPDGNHAQRTTPIFEAALDEATPAQLDAAAIAIENVNGPVILLGGDDDGVWPSCRLADIAWARLGAAGHTTRYADQHVCFASAGHFLGGPPGYPAEGSTVYRSTFGRLITGGTPAGNAHAQRMVDTMLRALLATMSAG